MADLIDRQAAIDAVNRAVTKEAARWSIQELPSAQPEIIRCKDCKHKYLENDIWVCPFGLLGGPEFFCGYGARMMEVEHEDD